MKRTYTYRRRRIPTKKDSAEMDLFEKQYRVRDLVLAILNASNGYIDCDSLVTLALSIDEKIQGIKT